MMGHEPTYIEVIAQRIWRASGESADWYPENEASLWLGYAVLCRATGTQTTSEDVHDAWAAWAVVRHNGVHRSLIPFTDLAPEIRAYDDLYRDAIHQIAREDGDTRLTEAEQQAWDQRREDGIRAYFRAKGIDDPADRKRRVDAL